MCYVMVDQSTGKQNEEEEKQESDPWKVLEEQVGKLRKVGEQLPEYIRII